MIKLQPPTTEHRQFHNFRCGEVLCIGPTTYHVCCALCGQKILYESFPQHFRLEHLSQPEEYKLFDKDGKLVKKGETVLDTGVHVKVEDDPIAHENNEHAIVDLAQIALLDLYYDNDNDENVVADADADESYDNVDAGCGGDGQETTWNGGIEVAAEAAEAAKVQVAKRSRPKRSVTRELSKRRNGLTIKIDEPMKEESTTLTISKDKNKDYKQTLETLELDNLTHDADDDKKIVFDQQFDGNGNNDTTVIEDSKNNQQVDNFNYDDDDDDHDHEDYVVAASDSNSNYEIAISFPCDECERRYISRRGLQYHKRTKHNPKHINKITNSSSVTAESFSKTKKKKNATVTTSSSSSSIQEQYKCSDCDQVFRNERELRGHRWKHTGIKCDICGKPFSQTGNMTRHRIRHSGIKSFKCGECDACFYTNKELNSHNICHTGKMPMICEICGRPCRDRGVLTAHMRRHTGERPAKCDVCGKCFYSFHDLNVHAVSHTSARPFACDLCGSTFQRKKALRVHKLLHSGKRKYDCKICGKGFAQYGGLNAHLRIHDASAIRAATAIAALDSNNSKTLGIPDISDVVANDISDTDDIIQEVVDSDNALEETTYTNQEQENINNMETTSNVTFIMTTV